MLGKWFAQWLCCFALLFTGHVPAKQAEQSLYILGVVQDAGFPQIGCYQAHCLPAWQDKRLQRGAVSIALIDQKHRKKLNEKSQKFRFEIRTSRCHFRNQREKLCTKMASRTLGVIFLNFVFFLNLQNFVRSETRAGRLENEV